VIPQGAVGQGPGSQQIILSLDIGEIDGESESKITPKFLELFAYYQEKEV
jgi:hypothetical protein